MIDVHLKLAKEMFEILEEEYPPTAEERHKGMEIVHRILYGLPEPPGAGLSYGVSLIVPQKEKDGAD